MHTQNKRILKIYVAYKSFHHIYHSERIVDLDELELSDEAWLVTVLRRISESSSENRISSNVVYFIKTAIKCLKSDSEGWRICQIREKDLTPKILHTLFRVLEVRIRETDHTSESIRQASSKFRAAVLNTKFKTNEEITVNSVRYKSRLGSIQHVLQPILNMEDHLNDLEDESPLGAVPHKNYLDLIERSSAILQGDLSKIVDACNQDLFIAQQNRLKIKSLKCKKINNLQKKEILSTLFKQTSSLTKKILGKHSAENILAIFRKGVLQHDSPMKRDGTFKLHNLARNCVDIGLVDCKGFSPRQTFFSPERLTTIELQAIFILLLCRTGWNQDALAGMDRDGITANKDGFAYVLQGFKEKTDDDTPPIFIDRTESDVIYALDLLLWNFEQLRSYALLSLSNKRIWHSWSTNGQLLERQSTTIQMTPVEFIERNNLFYFTLNQIRRTVLCIDAYKSKSFETARQRGGHSSIGTTGRYLDQIITRNISSSINLQFQIDLENKVIFNINLRRKRVSTWESIGDGSICTDPRAGLYSDRSADLICSAQHCHANGGCPQRKIIIDEEEVLNIVRTREYYFKNWQRLRSENQERFNIIIAPKIAFNEALYNYVKNSRYGYVMNKIESAFLDVEDVTHEPRHI